jgi:hypothetical protein
MLSVPGLPDGTKNRNFGNFLKALKVLVLDFSVYLMALWNFYNHLEYFMAVWYIL